MKDKHEQIKFTDQKLLPLFSIKSVQDYISKVSLESCQKNKDLLNQLNKLLSEIKEVFPVKNFNLHKTKNEIISYTQAYALLKTCLTICNIPYEIIRKNKISYVRLSPKNIILENYIKTHLMSDIRVNQQLVIKEPEHTKIEYLELTNSIRKEYEREYYYPLTKMLGNKKYTKICLSLGRTVLKDLRNMTISIKNNNKNKDIQESCEKIFYGLEYTIGIGGYFSIFTSKIEKNKNILPENPIYPFDLLIYQDFEIQIACKEEDMDFLNNIAHADICIKINHVEITKEMKNKINKRNQNITIDVPFNLCHKENYLVFSGGMATLRIDYGNNSNKNETKTIEELMNDIEGNEFTTDKYKCYRVTDGTHMKDPEINLLKVLAYGYDIAIQKYNDIPLKSTYYTKEKNVFTFRHVFTRVCDAISSNISIKLPYVDLAINSIKIIIYGGYIDSKTNYLEQREILPAFYFDNKTDSWTIDLPKNHYLPMAPYGTELIFSVTDCDNYTTDIIENTKLSYDYLFATSNNSLRQSIIHNIDDFIL